MLNLLRIVQRVKTRAMTYDRLEPHSFNAAMLGEA